MAAVKFVHTYRMYQWLKGYVRCMIKLYNGISI